MAQEALGGLVVTEISENGSLWLTIVCEETSSSNGTASVSETKTKCGTFTAPSVNARTITGSGVAGGNLSSSEASYQRLQHYLEDNTLLHIRRQNAADAANGITAGEIVYMHGRGYVTEATDTAQEGDIIKFNYALTFTGDVAYYPGS